MDPFLVGLALLGVLIVLLVSGAWIFVGLLLTSFFCFFVLLGFPLERIGAIAKPILVGSVLSAELAAIPLFLWMGEIINRTSLSTELFRGVAPWVGRLPGGLLHVNVGGSVIFAAVSGSSIATAATMGRVTMTELRERGYNTDLAVGSITVAGTIGIMMPPSITMIVYGLISETSVTQLFAAGVIPALILGFLFSSLIGIRCVIDPSLASPAVSANWQERLRSLRYLLPTFVLIIAVLGSIYTGLATPSESAAVGVLGAIVMAQLTGGISVREVLESGMRAVIVTAMIGSALAAATLLSTAIGFLHLPQAVTTAIAALDLSPFVLIAMLTVLYVLLGCVLDGIAMVLMTVPVILPLVVANGFDPIWFGVYLVLVVEMGLVTPPVGFNLFVLRAITGLPLERIALATLPFFGLMLLAAALFTLFPEVVLWLPNLLR
jgi:tripartite ATP-independent transporter DctM subunit